MDQIHLSPLVDQIQLALGHISNISKEGLVAVTVRMLVYMAIAPVGPLGSVACNMATAPPSPWVSFVEGKGLP
jgi:hypothetical protein